MHSVFEDQFRHSEAELLIFLFVIHHLRVAFQLERLILGDSAIYKSLDLDQNRCRSKPITLASIHWLFDRET